MDGIIEVKVNGHSISKDNTCAGAQYEANSTKLRITFSDNWSGYTKKVTFWDALGGNPVKRWLTTDLLEDAANNTNVYIAPIPAEAMTEAGRMTFVVDGYIDGVRKRTVKDTLIVLDSDKADDAGDVSDPTPSQAEQLQTQIEDIIGDIQEVNKNIGVSGENADKAELAAGDARHYADLASSAVGKTSYIGADNYWYEWDASSETFVNTGVYAEGKTGVYIGDEAPTDPDVQVWVEDDGGDDLGEITEYVDGKISEHSSNHDNPHKVTAHQVGATTSDDVLLLISQSEDVKGLHSEVRGLQEQTEQTKADVEGLQKQINEEAHFRGYLSTNAKIQALEATPNDFAYSAESGTKWVYDEVSGWQDTGTPVPDQLTPASDATPLMNGEASAGQSNDYARGDHRHPTDTTRVSVQEFNELKSELGLALDAILAMQNEYIGGGAV